MRRTLLILFAVFFFTGIMITAEVNAGSYILYPTDDTWIFALAPYQDTNFGGEQGLATNMHSYNQLGYTFLKFSIPTFSGEEIQTVTLHLYQFDGAGVGVQATVIDLYSDNMWDENNITWNNFYSPTATVTYLATCDDGALYRGWSSWSFSWYESYGNTITIRVREGGSADNSHVWSSKEYSDADLRPYLELITTESFPWEIFYPAIIKKSIDKDKDGFTKDKGDCNDNDPEIYPDAFENCSDGIDNDCDGDIDASDEDCRNFECMPTGCNGEVCADEAVETICVWLAYYECYRRASCERQSDDKCGWTVTDELIKCLKDYGGPLP